MWTEGVLLVGFDRLPWQAGEIGVGHPTSGISPNEWSWIWVEKLPSGKLLHNYGKIHHF